MKTTNTTTSTASNRREIKVNKVVNIAEDGEITVLDGFFKYSDSFKGATGSYFYPISKTEYKEQTTVEAIAERLEDYYTIVELYENHNCRSFKAFAKKIKAAKEDGDFAFDLSYRELWDYLRKECGLDENTAFVFNCVGADVVLMQISKETKTNTYPNGLESLKQNKSPCLIFSQSFTPINKIIFTPIN